MFQPSLQLVPENTHDAVSHEHVEKQSWTMSLVRVCDDTDMQIVDSGRICITTLVSPYFLTATKRNAPNFKPEYSPIHTCHPLDPSKGWYNVLAGDGFNKEHRCSVGVVVESYGGHDEDGGNAGVGDASVVDV